jgi:ABC-type transport system involved in multi-copper enzyme maturation permease subunit
LTKPVSRFQYLAGKLLGLSVLNGIVLIVGSFAVFVFVQLMSTRAPIDNQDAAAVRNQVLVAREVARPQYTLIDPEKLRETVNSSIQNDSILRAEIADGIKSESDVIRQIRSQKTTEFMTAQRLVNGGESKEFIFSGLAEARRAVAQPVFRYCFHTGGDSSHEVFPVLMKFGDLQPIQVNFVPVQTNIVEIPVKAIQEDGTLVVTLVNAGVSRDGEIYPGQGSFNFDADGIQVLHRVGGFEGNFFRAVLIDWGKLIFISALGVGSASILSFPVAVLLSCTIFIIGSMSTFLSVALDNYSISVDANVFAQMFQYIIRAIVQFVWWALTPFSSNGSSADLIDGRVIPWELVFVSIVQVGICWSVAVFGLCLLAFKKKEIAIYSGGDG